VKGTSCVVAFRAAVQLPDQPAPLPQFGDIVQRLPGRAGQSGFALISENLLQWVALGISL
jgi:hypothetical protein